MRWPFAKYTGCGNDFILFDNRQKNFPISHPGLIQRLCHRQLGVGADGILLLEPSLNPQADYCMRIFNSDGTEAEMCGNGLRCFIKWLETCGLKGPNYCIEVMHQLYKGSLVDAQVCIDMKNPSEGQWNIPLSFKEKFFQAHFLCTGVPHVVIFVDHIDQVNLHELGPYLRYHPLWQPQGTNVTCVEQIEPQRLKVRTYERGVEAETLACGTGAVAAALAVAYQNHLAKSPLLLETKLGEELSVGFVRQQNLFSHITLTGPAQAIFEGEIDLKQLTTEKLSFSSFSLAFIHT